LVGIEKVYFSYSSRFRLESVHFYLEDNIDSRLDIDKRYR
jgi:hypothetical protein